MNQDEYTCPMPRENVVDLYFMEHRAKVLDVASFLDRIDRSNPEASCDEDYRITALKEALTILSDGKGERAKRVLEVWSDPTDEPIPSAGIKGAAGAYAGPIPPA